MAEKLGITVEFKGETTEFEKALKSVNNELKTTKSEIGTLNKQLRLDPANVDLLQKKFDLLNNKSKELTEKVKLYQEALKNMPDDKIGSDEWVKLNKELNKAQVELSEVNNELSKMPTAKVQSLTKNLEEVEKKLNKISSTLESVGKKFMVLTGAITGLATAGVKYNAELERQTALFTGLTGSAEEAQKVLSQIKDNAIKSPFDVQSLISANQYLMASGIEAEKSMETINALGNAIASTGGGNSELQRMAQNLQQIQNVGKASTMDLRQFAMAGVDVWGILSDSTGKTVKQLQSMTITYDMLSEALIKASSEGGKYAGGMEAQAETLNGKLSKLKSTFQELLGELTEVLMPIIKRIIDVIQGWVNSLKALNDTQKKTITKIALMVASIAPVLLVISKVIGAVSSLVGIVKTIIGSNAFISFISSVTSAGGGLSSVIAVLGQKLAFLINPITAIVGGLALLYAKSNDFRKAVNNLVSNIKKSLIPIFNTIKKAVNEIINVISGLVSNITKSLKPIIETIIQILVNIINTLSNLISKIINALAPTISTIISVFTSFIKVVSNVVGWLVDKLSPAFEFVWKVVQLVTNVVLILANNIGDVLIFAFEKLKSILNVIKKAFESVVEWITKLYNKFADTTFGQKFIEMINKISGVINSLKDGFTSLMNWLDKLIGKTNTIIGQQGTITSRMSNGGRTWDTMNSGGLGMNVNINVTNNGTPIDTAMVNSWAETIAERVDYVLGRNLT